MAATRMPSPVEDLARERARASFAVRPLTHFLNGSTAVTERKERIHRLVAQEPVFDYTMRPFQSRPERFAAAVGVAKRMMELKRQHNLTEDEFDDMRDSVNEILPTLIHEGVFMPALLTQASDEQLARYKTLAENMGILGAYAQTELGHGSNVRALQTTATYMPQDDTFDMHTPTIEATKWWIGGLGKLATHAVVWARLLIDKKDYGIHPFMVQIRALDTHMPMPGVTVGDIGPKFAFNTVDNGFLRLTHVRIPRTDMLSRNARVLKGGAFEKPENDKLGYAGMLTVRAGMVMDAAKYLAQSVTIAVRYSAVRRQGGPLGQETAILDYSVQQYRLLPLLAATYGLHFTGVYMHGLFTKLKSGMNAGDLSELPDVHVAAAGLKSLCTTLAANGMEECRKLCGGHGYSQLSGLPERYASYVHNNTAEGDNYLMTQQTARYLVKLYAQTRAGGAGRTLTATTSYLNMPDAERATERARFATADDLMQPEVQLAIFAHQAARLLSSLARQLEAGTAAGLRYEDVWNRSLVEVYNVSNVHCRLILVQNFHAGVQGMRTSHPAHYAVLKRLADLFALYWVEQTLADHLEDGYLNSRQAGLVRQQVRTLLGQVRPDAVALVDAWNFPDHVLGSAIGRYDGNVYQALFDWVQKEPLNAQEVLPGYEHTLAPLFRAGRDAAQRQLEKEGRPYNPPTNSKSKL